MLQVTLILADSIYVFACTIYMYLKISQIKQLISKYNVFILYKINYQLNLFNVKNEEVVN